MRPLNGSRGGLHPDGPTTIETFAGYTLDLADPQPDGICVADIAHALSNLCRFGGHSHGFYSVAEHSVLVHDLTLDASADPQLAAAALFHDAHEAYLLDIPSPLKVLIKSVYEALANRMDNAIGQALGVDPAQFKARDVKVADSWALIIEARQIRPARGWDWARGAAIPGPPERVEWTGDLTCLQAEQTFLTRAGRLADLGVIPPFAATAIAPSEAAA